MEIKDRLVNTGFNGISSATELAVEMNGNGAKFIYHNGKIEGVTSYTGDVRTLLTNTQ